VNLIKKYADVLFIIPFAIFLLVVSYKLIPWIDPRAGVFDLGPLQTLIFNIVTTLAVFFIAWLAIRVYSIELSTQDEESLLAKLTPLQRLTWEGFKWSITVGSVAYLLLRNL